MLLMFHAKSKQQFKCVLQNSYSKSFTGMSWKIHEKTLPMESFLRYANQSCIYGSFEHEINLIYKIVKNQLKSINPFYAAGLSQNSL